MKFEIILLFLVLLIPYSYLGEEYAAVILAFGALIYLLKNRKNIRVNKVYTILVCSLLFFGIISMYASNNITKSLSGFCVYMNALLYYLIFSNIKKEKNLIIKWFVYIVSISSLAFIIYQGVICKTRIDGNLGYANTYALLLLISVYLNELIQENNYLNEVQFILMLGIIYTGSRNTLFYLIIFVVIKVIYDIKREDKFTSVINFALAVMVYISVQYAGFGMVLLLPIIIYLWYDLLKKTSSDLKNGIAVGAFAIAIPLILLLNTNFSKRVRNSSFSLGVLQERFVYFQDVIKHIFYNPFGSGINSFEYRQYIDQSAFYDVKFVHNSILQVGYDVGIIGMMIFLAIGIYGLILIVKSGKQVKYYIPLYITIYLHSLLDFDFSFAVIFITVIMIVGLTGQSREDNEMEIKFSTKKYAIILCSILIAFVSYLTFVNGISIYSDSLVSNKEYDQAIGCYKFYNSITFKDPDGYSKIAEAYNRETGDSQNKNELYIKCSDNLTKALEINPTDPRIIGNIAFTYTKLNNDSKAIYYYDSFLSIEKYYDKMYKTYYDFLNEKYLQSGNIIYKEKMEDLKKIYEKNYKSLNPKSKYMNDQLPADFNEMLVK
ncbi:MAG: O-antigen ligase family protein [Bacillota bacterium]|nr:O-antigen ligase family protein [Bacillota bacterium]